MVTGAPKTTAVVIIVADNNKAAVARCFER